MYQEQIDAKNARIAEIDGLLTSLQEERATLVTEVADLNQQQAQALPSALAFVETNLAAIREYSGQLADHLQVIIDDYATFQVEEAPAPPSPQG